MRDLVQQAINTFRLGFGWIVRTSLTARTVASLCPGNQVPLTLDSFFDRVAVVEKMNE